jgi:hypothetical protein
MRTDIEKMITMSRLSPRLNPGMKGLFIIIKGDGEYFQLGIYKSIIKINKKLKGD